MDSRTEDTTNRAAARPYAAGRFALEIDGKNVGYLKSVEGGGITADVINEQGGADYFVHKHIGQPKYEDVTAVADLSLDQAFYAWIADTLSGKYSRKDVVIYTLDANNKIQRQSQHFNCLITEVGFPANDASSKDAAYLTVKFAPEYTRYTKASGKISSLPVKGQQKKWLAANFRLEISGLDCTKVNKIEAFTVKQAIPQEAVGEQRDYLREPGRLEFPNLAITLAESAAQTWQDWFDDFVVKGNNGADQEKNGSLTFLAPDLKTALAQIELSNLGIFKLTTDKVEAVSENIRRLKAELYVERMVFKM